MALSRTSLGSAEKPAVPAGYCGYRKAVDEVPTLGHLSHTPHTHYGHCANISTLSTFRGPLCSNPGQVLTHQLLLCTDREANHRSILHYATRDSVPEKDQRDRPLSLSLSLSYLLSLPKITENKYIPASFPQVRLSITSALSTQPLPFLLSASQNKR